MKEPDFGERLKRAMDRAGVRATDLAKQMGIAPQTVSNWRAGRRPSRRNIHEIARILEVPPRQLEDAPTTSDAINHFYVQEAMPPPSEDEWGKLNERERRAVGEIIRLLARRTS